MREIADTGDILLFKGREAGAAVQRAFTNSNYNHVAVILRSSEGTLKFIEATSDIVSRFPGQSYILMLGVNKTI